MRNRVYYEKQLESFIRMGGGIPKDVDKLTDKELMTTINNWLIFYDSPPFTPEEIQKILDAT